ncbi:MAG: DNA adenine methylase [Bacteroidales bacterium]|jgi:DNA adenine methylase|nr:DNA adenine methylase [Bacteroidales bacterium]
MIKSPLRYPGGKSKAVVHISKLIPCFEEFREPFLGSGAVFVYLKQQHPNKRFWINDLCSELYKFWVTAQKNTNTLIDKIYEWHNIHLTGKELYQFLKGNMNNFTDLECAAAFFILNRITFSGTTLSGGFSRHAFENRFTESSIQRIRQLTGIVNGTTITNYDYEKLLKTTGSNVFIYLDPPYYSATKSALYGKNGNLHKTFDHIRFAENMRNCRHKWLITYDDCEYIRNLFSFASIITWNQTYSMRNTLECPQQTGKELFISNYLI